MSSAHTPVAAGPVLVYTPAASGTPHGYIFNEGISTVYVGGPGVSTHSGIPLPPNEGISLENAPSALYACGSYVVSSSGSVTTAASAGGTVVVVGGITPAAGNILVIDGGTPSQEVATVQAFAAGGSVTTTAPILFGHAVNAGASIVNVLGSSVHVESGAS